VPSIAMVVCITTMHLALMQNHHDRLLCLMHKD
jgi:hypothetical protein